MHATLFLSTDKSHFGVPLSYPDHNSISEFIDWSLDAQTSAGCCKEY